MIAQPYNFAGHGSEPRMRQAHDGGEQGEDRGGHEQSAGSS
jgi:hypothetical protein